MTPQKGDRFKWFAFGGHLDIEVMRVARDGTWCDIRVFDELGPAKWTKRQPLPFPSTFTQVQESA